MPRDYYEVLNVPRDADEADDQEVVPPAGARAAPGRQRPRSRGRGEVQGGRRGLRGALRRRAAPDVRLLRPRGPEDRRLLAQLRGLRIDQRPVQRVLRAGRVRRRVRRHPDARRGRAGRRRRAGGGDRSRRGGARDDGRGHLRRDRAVRDLPRQRRASPARRSSPATAATAPARSSRSSAPASARWCGPRCATSAAATAGSPRQPCHTCDGRGMVVAQRRVKVDIPAGIADGQRLRMTGRGHAGERGGPAATCTSSSASRRTSASSATARTS